MKVLHITFWYQHTGKKGKDAPWSIATMAAVYVCALNSKELVPKLRGDMKVLHITLRLHLGGIRRYCILLSEISTLGTGRDAPWSIASMAAVYVCTADSSKYPTNAWQCLGDNMYARK
jgi:hypothetical protein